MHPTANYPARPSQTEWLRSAPSTFWWKESGVGQEEPSGAAAGLSVHADYTLVVGTGFRIEARRPVCTITLVVLADAATTHAEHEEVAVVLCVQATEHVDRERRVGRADRQVGEDPGLGRGEDATMPLVDDVYEPVLALHVDVAVTVDGWGVDAPLEPVGVRPVVNAGHRSVGIAVAALHLGALELPLGLQVFVDLSDVERTRRDPGRVAHGQAVREVRGVAVETRLLVVMVVLHHDREVAAAARDYGERVIPAEVERGLELTAGAELEEVPAGDVVPGVGAEHHAAVGQDSRRRRAGVDDPAGRHLVGRRVDAGGRVKAAFALLHWLGLRRFRDQHAAAVVDAAVAQRRRPLQSQVGV